MTLIPRKARPLLVVLTMTLAAGLSAVTTPAPPVAVATPVARHVAAPEPVYEVRQDITAASRSIAVHRHRLHVAKVKARIARAKAEAAREAAAAAQAALASPGHDWDAVANCESGGHWAENTGNGYYGGLQFSLATWQANGGSGLPSENSREVQIAVAEEVLEHSTWQTQWPVCGQYL